MVASGQVDVKPLITHTYQLEETLKAFQQAKTGEGGAIKVCMSTRHYEPCTTFYMAPRGR